MKLTWNILFKALNKRFWNEELCWVPTFCTELEGEKLGDFEFTPQGFNLIKLASNQGLTEREACGVLLHEMCHQAVFEKHGYELDGHGVEWQTEMKAVGFTGEIDEYTDGTTRFDHKEYAEIMEIYNKFLIDSMDEECQT